MEETFVVIVGAGIVGLTAALLLSKQKVPVIVVERNLAPSVHPRARGLNIRSMEVFRECGLQLILEEAGQNLSRAQGWYEGSSVSEILGSLSGTQRPPAIFASKLAELRELTPTGQCRATQDVVEPIILKAANQTGADFRFGWKLKDLKQTEDYVQVWIVPNDNSDDRTIEIRCKWVIAADGVHSTVRNLLQVPREGRGCFAHFYNILFYADLKDWMQNREFSGCVIKQEQFYAVLTTNDKCRWTLHVRWDPSRQQKSEFTEERCIELIQQALCFPDVSIKILHHSPWECAERVTRNFQMKRILFAGDSAHQMPPFGGQGANCGIADAYNLAWKLVGVYQHWADELLLTTYHDERYPIGKLTAEESSNIADEHGGVSATQLTNSLVTRWYRIIGYGFQYQSRCIIPDDNSPPFTFDDIGVDGRPGCRMPHIWFVDSKGGNKISSLDLLGNNNFLLLVGFDDNSWKDSVAVVKQQTGVPIDCFSIGSSSDQVDFIDTEDRLCSTSNMSSKGALLIRPDGYVAKRFEKTNLSSREYQVQILLEYFKILKE